MSTTLKIEVTEAQVKYVALLLQKLGKLPNDLNAKQTKDFAKKLKAKDPGFVSALIESLKKELGEQKTNYNTPTQNQIDAMNRLYDRLEKLGVAIERVIPDTKSEVSVKMEELIAMVNSAQTVMSSSLLDELCNF